MKWVTRERPRIFADDRDMLRAGMVMDDARFAWCGSGQREPHNWPPRS